MRQFRRLFSGLCLLFMASLIRAEKHALGELPETNPTPTTSVHKKVPISNDDDQSPVQRPSKKEIRQKHERLAEEYFRQGIKAKENGRYDEAEGYFDRVLMLNPHHVGAKNETEWLMKRMEPPKLKPTPTPKKTTTKKKVPDEKKHEEEAVMRSKRLEAMDDLEGALSSLKEAKMLSHSDKYDERMASIESRLLEQKRQRSQDLYLKALTAFQNNRPDEAKNLCRKALDVDPTNLQAERMLLRLNPPANH